MAEHPSTLSAEQLRYRERIATRTAAKQWRILCATRDLQSQLGRPAPAELVALRAKLPRGTLAHHIERMEAAGWLERQYHGAALALTAAAPTSPPALPAPVAAPTTAQ